MTKQLCGYGVFDAIEGMKIPLEIKVVAVKDQNLKKNADLGYVLKILIAPLHRLSNKYSSVVSTIAILQKQVKVHHIFSHGN